MIEWMQRHRKYLVITIWISTIAFVGAGFVGWGAYSFGTDKASSVATVGHREISVQEFQMAYSNQYSYYNNLFNGQLTQEKAKDMGLENIVMKNLINQTLLLNYADDLGLKALDSDIKKKLANDSVFQQDGVFQLEQYKRVLKNIGIKPKDYEANLAKEILLDKVQKILFIKPNKQTIEMLGSSQYMQDKIATKTIVLELNDIEVDEKELEEFWKPKQAEFLTKKTYEIKSIFVDANKTKVDDASIKEFYEEKKYNYLDNEGKIKSLQAAKEEIIHDLKLSKTKKEALKKYLKVKKGEIKLSDSRIINEDNPLFDNFADTSVETVLKPVQEGNGYIIPKLIKINEPKPMGFQEAKSYVVDEYKTAKLNELLKKKAQEALQSFEGTDLGYVSIDSNITIPQLTQEESSLFLEKLFSKNTKKDYALIENKAVIYDILEQKLLSKEKLKEHNKELTQMARKFENDQIQKSLLDELSKRYSVTQHYEGS